MNINYFKRFAPPQLEQNSQKGKRAVIYTRVSSKDQINTSSLDTQLKTCTEFAIKNNFRIISYFGGIYESAKFDEDRKEFQRMLSFVTESSNNIGSIIVFNYDRFSRTGL